MHFFALTIAATMALLPEAFAQNIRIQNSCTFPVYLRSVQNNNQGTSPLVTVQPAGSYSEAYKTGGVGIAMGVQPMLSAPLTLEYTPNGGLVYYDLSNNRGNPFLQFRNILTPANNQCFTFNCPPQSSPFGGNCYSNGQSIKVKTCKPTDFNLRLCAAKN